MKKSSIVFIGVFIATIFLVSLGYFGFNLYNEQKNGINRSSKIFDKLCDEIEEKITYNNETDLVKILESLNDKYNNFEDFDSFSILKNNKIVASFPDTNVDLSNKNSTKFTKFFPKQFVVAENVYQLNCKMYTLSPSAIAHYAKTAFLIILISTVLVIIISIIVDKSTSNSKITEEASEEYQENENSEEVSEEDNYEESESQVEENQLEDEENSEPELPSTELTASEPEKPVTAETEKDFSDSDSVPETEKPETTKITTFLEENKNIYSETTGFIKQDFLESRLENEITKSGSCELDLSLFIVKIAGFNYSNPSLSKVYDVLMNIFQFKDFIFEYNNDGFAIIKPDMNVDTAEALADDIYNEIKNALAETGLKDIFVGISSTALRLISAQRLITETNQALTHAMNDDESNIIAFHVDLEKYREFIKNS